MAKLYCGPDPSGFDFGGLDFAEGDFQGAGPVLQPQSVRIHRNGFGVPRLQDREQERRQPGSGDPINFSHWLFVEFEMSLNRARIIDGVTIRSVWRSRPDIFKQVIK